MNDLNRRVQAAARLYGYSFNPAYIAAFNKGAELVLAEERFRLRLNRTVPDVGGIANNLATLMMARARGAGRQVITLADLEDACQALGYVVLHPAQEAAPATPFRHTAQG